MLGLTTRVAVATTGLTALAALVPATAADAAPARIQAAPVNAAACPGGGAKAAADSYLAALLSHDAAKVPFAADVTRVENGLVTGSSAEEIRTDLNTSVKYQIITGLRERTYTSAPGRVQVRYLLDVGFNAPLVGTVTVATVSVDERFDVTCGKITFIKATIGPT